MMTTPSDAQHTQLRHSWNDATFSDVITLRLPPAGFTFAQVDQCDRAVKASEIGRLRGVKAQARGVTDPRIVLFSLLAEDRGVSEVFPAVDTHTEAGEQLYSANSFLTYTLRVLLARNQLRFDGQTWSAVVPDSARGWKNRSSATLALLSSERRLYACDGLGRRISNPVAFQDFDTRRDLVPLGRLGFLREFVWRSRPRAAFNTAFFLLEHDDYFSHHSALGEGYNLYVADSVILRPPLYRRAAFYQAADGRWHTGYLSLQDVTIRLPDGTVMVPKGCKLQGLPFNLDPVTGAEVAAYTRASGLANTGQPLRRTPTERGRVEFTVVDTRIVSHKRGGGLAIPQNGLVLSFSPSAFPAEAFPGEGLHRVRYGFAREEQYGMRQAIQAGPMLVRNGHVAVSAESLVDEEFRPTPLGASDTDEMGIVPTDYPDDVDRTRAGRIGLGVDGKGGLVVVAVPGTERGTLREQADSAGATLVELAEFLVQAGAVDALNLDGGGSTHLFYMGGLATIPGARLGMPGVCFERMVPDIGVFW